VHIIVIGCGRVGSSLAIALSQKGHDIVVIDTDEESFKRLGVTFNGITLRGSGCDEDLLLKAGIDRCDAFAAVTNSDSANTMSAEIASRLYHVPKVVARLYLPEREQTMQFLGIDYVNGVRMTVQPIMDKLLVGSGQHLFIRGDLEVIEFQAGPEIHNRKIVDVQIPNEFRICLVTREGSTFLPWRDTILKDRDILLTAVRSTSFPKIAKYIRKK
jgi:trk system potassium uptake protein TrkA